jgi:hypothetical protein
VWDARIPLVVRTPLHGGVLDCGRNAIDRRNLSSDQENPKP